MRKRLVVWIGMMVSVLLLGGCGSETAVLSEMKTGSYVKLGEYKGIEISVPAQSEVTEELRQNYIGYILSSHPQWVEAADGAGANVGDVVNIDFEGRIDGELFEGGSSQGYELQLGSHAFIEGFEDGLVGVSRGETKDLTLQFPDPYERNPDLSGVPVVFTVTVNSIQTQQTPELTDAFVQSLDVGCNTVEEYESYIQSLLDEEMKNTYDRNVEDALIGRVMSGCSFKKDPPKAMVDQYYDRVVRRMSRIAALSGMTLEEYINAQGYNMEGFEEEARAGAAESCRESIMLQAVANAEGITVSQEEVDTMLSEQAQAGGYESVDALKADLDYDNYEDYVMCDKVLAFLREQAVVSEY